jgi:hypothetical protein
MRRRSNLILAAVITMWAAPAYGGDIVDCTERPGAGRWVYRIIDARRCWFPAGSLSRGEEKPREELRWPTRIESNTPAVTQPESPDVPAVSIMVPEPEPPPLESEFERRWRGAPAGWDHNE